MNTLSGTLLFLLALLMSGSTYADSPTATSTTPTETSTLSNNAMTDTAVEHSTKDPDSTPPKKHIVSTEPTDSEAASSAVVPSTDKHPTANEAKTTDNSEKTTTVNYDEEEQPDEDSCD